MFTLDYQSRLPIYEQLYKSIIKMASLGVMEPNEKLPSVRVLGQQLGVNPNTVQKAYQMLERDSNYLFHTGKRIFYFTGFIQCRRKKVRGIGKSGFGGKRGHRPRRREI